MDPTRRLIAVINSARCTGCGWCVGSCPWHLLSLEVRHWKKTSTLQDPAACTGCRLCEPRCPFGVISMAPVASLGDGVGASEPDQTS